VKKKGLIIGEPSPKELFAKEEAPRSSRDLRRKRGGLKSLTERGIGAKPESFSQEKHQLSVQFGREVASIVLYQGDRFICHKGKKKVMERGTKQPPKPRRPFTWPKEKESACFSS